MTKNEDLKACPFCGEAKIYLNDTCVNCPCCLATMPIEGTDKNEMIRAWNTRPTVIPTDSAMEDAAQREPAEMVETLKEGTSPRLEGTSSTTDGDAERALEAVQAWFDSIEWREETGKPFKYKDSEEVLYKHGETIRAALQSTRKPPVDTINIKREVLQGVRDTIAYATTDMGDDSLGRMRLALASLDAVLAEGKS